MSVRIYPLLPPALPPERRRRGVRFVPLTPEDLARARTYVARIRTRETKRRCLCRRRVPA